MKYVFIVFLIELQYRTLCMENWRNLNRHFKSISHHLRHPVNTNQLNCTVLQGEGILTLLGFLQKRNMKTHLKTHFRKMKRETLLFI